MKLKSLLVLHFVITTMLGQIPDHQKLIEALRNNEDILYKSHLKSYNDYIIRNPKDAKGWVEKCRYVQLAQYNYSEDYNPNYDSFIALLDEIVIKFPKHPDVTLLKLENVWDEERYDLLVSASKWMYEVPSWTKSHKALIYYNLADHEYSNNQNYQKAKQLIMQATSLDSNYAYDLLYARICIELKQNDEAKATLLDHRDTNKSSYVLGEKARLLILLNAFKEATKLYEKIRLTDTSYGNAVEISKALAGAGQYSHARKFLEDDTLQEWNKEMTLFNLYQFDVKYMPGKIALSSYESWRDKGYKMDPLAIERIKLFAKDPTLPWNFRDLLGILSLIILIILLGFFPVIIIALLFSIHTFFKLKEYPSPDKFNWGLGALWFVFFGYLMASFFACWVQPEYIKELFGIEVQDYEFTELHNAKNQLIYMVISAIIAAILMFRKTFSVFQSSTWSLGLTFSSAIGCYVFYRMIFYVYVLVCKYWFDYDVTGMESPSAISQIVEDTKVFISTYGLALSILFIGVIVPIYEEIIFRGVILNSISKLFGFKWANILQSIIFAIAHLEIGLIPIYFVFGLLSGLLVKRSESLTSGIIFHMVNNILVVIALNQMEKVATITGLIH